MKPSLTTYDQQTLSLIIERARSAHAVAISLTELRSLCNIAAFLERPTPRDIDDIVAAKNLRPDETHAVEQTVIALWGAP